MTSLSHRKVSENFEEKVRNKALPTLSGFLHPCPSEGKEAVVQNTWTFSYSQITGERDRKSVKGRAASKSAGELSRLLGNRLPGAEGSLGKEVSQFVLIYVLRFRETL